MILSFEKVISLINGSEKRKTNGRFVRKQVEIQDETGKNKTSRKKINQIEKHKSRQEEKYWKKRRKNEERFTVDANKAARKLNEMKEKNRSQKEN